MAFNKAKALQEAEKFVSQGKISQAIKQYLLVVQKEPSDLVILNTVGDLYVREKNIREALKHFHKLADAYSREGFTVKAIAILKKISKLDASDVEVLIKTGDLYVLQGLAREARDQYAQAVEAYRKKNQTDRALEAFGKIVALDPENAGYRSRFADFCQQVGKKAEAAKAFAEAADLAFRHGDVAAAEAALKKAAALDAQNPQVQLLRARVAIQRNDAAEAEKILNAAPSLKSSPAAQPILLQVYLATQKVEQAEKLVVSVFRTNPTDFSPMTSFAEQCISKGNFDAALAPLAEVADSLIELKSAGPLVEVLRKISGKSPQPLPALELMYKVADKTADEGTIPDVLESLGEAYARQENWEKAEWAYQKLVSREPENANYKALLRQVQQKQGKAGAATPADFSQAEVPLEAESSSPVAGAATAPEAPSAEEAALVKEALENSDLFSQYGLAEKAVAELEKVLEPYPDQIDIHRRILEVCLKNLPERGAQAAKELARIHAARGDADLAAKYELSATTGAPPPVVEISTPPQPEPEAQAPPASEALPAEPAQPAAQEFDLSAGIPGAAPGEAPAPGPQEVPVDLTPPPAAEAAPAAAAPEEFDLSAGLESIAAPSEAAPPAPAGAAAGFNFEESRVEIDFYLSQGFTDEAQKAVETLERRFPGNSQVAELRALVEGQAAAPSAAAPEAIPGAAPEPTAPAEEAELPPAFAQPPPSEATAFEAPPAAGPVEEPAPPAPMPVEEVAAPEPAPKEPAAPPAAPPQPAAASPSDPLGSLVGDLAESLEGIEEQAPPGRAPAPSRQAPPSASASASPLSGLLEELGEEGGGQAAVDDPQTHYDLGVAFREMSLLDEAIGEFQKVVKGAQKGQYPPNFLQACTLLATCFMDKSLPAIAAKWYKRALESPNLDEEAVLALEYDMGVAYEQAGDAKTALEKYSEVYSQNIDYRDVAEKIRQLQQKK